MGTTTPMSTLQFGKAIDPAIRHHFTDEMDQVKSTMEKIFTVEKQEDYNQKTQNYSDLGTLSIVGEGQPYPSQSIFQTYGTTFTPVKHGGVITLTDEFIRYDKSGISKSTNLARGQAASARRSIENRSAGVLRNGFNTSFTSLDDGRRLFDLTHARADGNGNQSNVSSTGLTLTEANLETGMLAFEDVLSDTGQLTSSFATTLVVPNQLRKEALIIARSEKRSGTADNDLNVYDRKNSQEFEGLSIDKVIVWKYLSASAGGSDTAWFLLGDECPLTWLWGVRPEVGKLNETVGYMNDTLMWKVRYEASTGWTDWRRTWGSKGDGISYT